MNCTDCLHSIIKPAEVICNHWWHPGLVMALDLRREKSELKYVCGVTDAKNCISFKPKVKADYDKTGKN